MREIIADEYSKKNQETGCQSDSVCSEPRLSSGIKTLSGNSGPNIKMGRRCGDKDADDALNILIQVYE